MPEQYYQATTYRVRDSVAYLVRRLHAIWLARFEQVLARAGLTLTQWTLLLQMRDGMVRTASDFAHDLQHDSGALTRVIDQLEQRGLVARRRSSRDRRRVELALTPAGEEMIRHTLPGVVEQANAALQPLSQGEFLQLRKHLSRMLGHVEQQRDAANAVAVSPGGQKARRPRTTASSAAKPARKRPAARKAARATR